MAKTGIAENHLSDLCALLYAIDQTQEIKQQLKEAQ